VARALGLDADLVVSSAWLHDIGYAATTAATGFHPLDGARFLRDQGIDERVVNLVAHHSHAVIEAEDRGADRELLAEFPLDASLPHDALCFCDMTTGPDGQHMVVRERLAEIRERYGPHDLVTRFITKAEPSIVETVERVERRLAAAAQSR
jgi:putative nucleotidyltransferase with HDIG domain